MLHTTFHAVFISVLVLRLGARAVLAKWVGYAYLFGAWFVLASGLYLGSVNAQVVRVRVRVRIRVRVRVRVIASGLYLGSVNAQVAATLAVAVAVAVAVAATLAVAVAVAVAVAATLAVAVAVVVALTLALALTRRQTRCPSLRLTRMHNATTNPSPRPDYVNPTPTPTPTPNPSLTRYTTPWHWLLYALAGQRDFAYPILVQGQG